MRDYWNRLRPDELRQKSRRVAIHFSRAGGNPLDADDFAVADELDELVGHIEPEQAERMLEESRAAVERGDLELPNAVAVLAAKFKTPTGKPADTKASKRLKQILSHALHHGVSLAEAAAHIAEEEENVPDEAKSETIRMQAAGEAIRYSRAYGHPQPPHQQFGRAEVNAAGNLMATYARKGKKLSFEQAVAKIRGY